MAKLYKRTVTFMRVFDIFGHPIKIFFKDQEGEYTTALGGLVTILMYAFLVVCTYGRISKVTQFKNPFIASWIGTIKDDEYNDFNFGDATFLPSLRIYPRNPENRNAVRNFDKYFYTEFSAPSLNLTTNVQNCSDYEILNRKDKINELRVCPKFDEYFKMSVKEMFFMLIKRCTKQMQGDACLEDDDEGAENLLRDINIRVSVWEATVDWT